MKNIYLLFIIFIFATIQTYSQDTLNVPTEYTTIQAAIDAANNDDIVLVDEDTYYENINFIGKAITVASHFLIDGDKEHIDNTIIDGNQNGSVVTFNSGEDTTSILCGFTITGGNVYFGGGIRCVNSGAKIIYNHILGNQSGYGGGLGVGGSERIVIENNTICNNVARGARGYSGSGGGISISGILEGRISNNLISQNRTVQRYQDANGGGIDIYGCNSLLISNNIIVDNTADGEDSYGGGIYISDTRPKVINNTIVNNKAGIGGGISLYEVAVAIIINNIIWGNIANTDSQLYDGTGNLSIYYSDIQDGWSGVGNIDSYPEFVDTANGDYHLANNSPCIGAGIDLILIGVVWYRCPLNDLEGNPRPNPVGSMPDIGGCESPLAVSGIENYLSQVPKAYSLEQNFPNPFNPYTKISYSIPQISNVVIKVFDILGNEIETIVNEEKSIGIYEITWYAENLPSGIYFYRLQAGSFVETKKMVLLR